MKAGEKNTRSREPMAKWKQEVLEILREPVFPAREYIPLSQAAERLGCTSDDLLTKGCAGEFDIYTPVLEEGAYIWPVTERGIPFERIMGDAAPVFTARFQRGDYGVLAASDLDVIKKLKKRVIPQGYICPSLTLRRIQEWEEARQEERPENLDAEGTVAKWREGAAERMQALAKTVPWIPSAGMKQEIDRQPTIDPWIDVDMLWLDSSDVPQRVAENQPLEEAKQVPIAPAVHLTNKRVNNLDSPIDDAIQAAGTDALNPVWQTLKEMALNEKSPFTGVIKRITLKKGTVEALVYTTDVSRKEDCMQDYLTKDGLRSRLKRRGSTTQRS